MLKGEPRGESKKPASDRPLIQGIFKKSSSPVQTAQSSQEIGSFFSYEVFLFFQITSFYRAYEQWLFKIIP